MLHCHEITGASIWCCLCEWVCSNDGWSESDTRIQIEMQSSVYEYGYVLSNKVESIHAIVIFNDWTFNQFESQVPTCERLWTEIKLCAILSRNLPHQTVLQSIDNVALSRDLSLHSIRMNGLTLRNFIHFTSKLGMIFSTQFSSQFEIERKSNPSFFQPQIWNRFS